jgi:hypothetical protein
MPGAIDLDAYLQFTIDRNGVVYNLAKGTTFTFKEIRLLAYYAVESAESQPTFRRNMSPPYSG